jgi:hypothetical protein
MPNDALSSAHSEWVIEAVLHIREHAPHRVAELLDLCTRDIQPVIPLLPWMAEHKQQEVPWLLHERFPPDQRTPEGVTALIKLGTSPRPYIPHDPAAHTAAWRALYAAGARLDAVTDEGATLWHYAAMKQHGVRRLLSYLPQGIDTPNLPSVDSQDKLGMTPLMYATMSSNTEQNISALLELGANPCIPQAQGFLASGLLKRSGHAASVRRPLLLEAEARYQSQQLQEAMSHTPAPNAVRPRV